jgi:hypothetical protein
MIMKKIKDLTVSDRVALEAPGVFAVVTRKEKSRIFKGAGGCFRLDFRVGNGPDKGAKITDQHRP